MDQLHSILTSPGFRSTMGIMALTCLLMAIGVAIIAFKFYGSKQAAAAPSAEEERWLLLFACWRDSLVITLLYTAQSFIYRYTEFSNLSQYANEGFYYYPQLVSPLASVCVDVLIFVVAAHRIIAITRWLASQRPSQS